MKKVFILALVILVTGCTAASKWKIQGGPQECKAMCDGWDLEFSGMVGVGNQDRSGEGATACVCTVKNESASISGSSASSTALSGPIAQAAAAQAAAAQSASISATNAAIAANMAVQQAQMAAQPQR